MKKGDIIVCVLVAAAGIFLLLFLSGNVSADTVEIYSSGTLFGKYSLSSDITVDVVTEFGSNTVCIEKGNVYVTHSSCDDKNEILQGKISHPGQSLICLPNKLIVTLNGRRENVDSISY